MTDNPFNYEADKNNFNNNWPKMNLQINYNYINTQFENVCYFNTVSHFTKSNCL